MSIEETNLFTLATRRLQWLADQQRVTSQNIANADVAEYKAREVESFDAYMKRVRNTAEVRPSAQILESKSTWGTDMTGNSVVLEEQIMQARSTEGEYRVAASLYRKAHEMMLTVAGRR